MFLVTELHNAASRNPEHKAKNDAIFKKLFNFHKMLMPELKEI